MARRLGLFGSRTPVGPLEYTRRAWVRFFLFSTFIFLYVPIGTLMIFSFNDSRRNIVWRGFTTKYYDGLVLWQ